MKTDAATPAFLPVSLAAPSAQSCDRRVNEATDAFDNRIEIELANGRRVQVGPGADLGALKHILDILDRR